ncbi:hypothetical protein AXA44_02705 [Rhodococcus sp. SC4]|nr:hypothetical protein AXA44_02705 [Rhodococcus sp. SC4]
MTTQQIAFVTIAAGISIGWFALCMWEWWTDRKPYDDSVHTLEPTERAAPWVIWCDKPAEPFTAWAMCPQCDRIACHSIRRPKIPTAAEVAAWREQCDDIVHETTSIQSWGGGGPVRSVTTNLPPEPVDESDYEVIRICNCGHEWGQL